jgi:signal transduction histidine kinase
MENEELTFVPEDEAGKPAAPWRIAVIDDDPAVHEATRFALGGIRIEGRELAVIGAVSAAEGRELIDTNPDIAVALVDVVMETEQAGLDLVGHIREVLGNRAIRLVLRTGQPGLAPAREVVTAYDINDYRAKTELDADRLYCTLVSALRAYRQIRDTEAARDDATAARRHAELAARAKSLFLTAMSHELRTPVSVIIAGLTMALDEELGPLSLADYGDDLADCRAQAGELLRMIDDILDVADLEDAGDRVALDGTVDVGDAIRHAVDRWAAHSNGAGDAARLRCDVPEGLPKLRGDARCVERIIANLLSNAIKFSPAGGEIVVSAGSVPDDHLEIAVRDPGIGMTEDETRHALEPFAQVDQGHTRRFGGLGLGLTISRALTELHGGTVAIESEPGGGTLVRIRFPWSRVVDGSAADR